MSAAAAPDGTLQAVLLVFVLAAVIVLPSLGLLYVLDQKGLLPGRGHRATDRPSDVVTRRVSAVQPGDRRPAARACAMRAS